MEAKRRVLILGFGGTIAMMPDAEKGLKPAKSIEEILAIVPSLKEMADVDFLQIEQRDSTNIYPSHWTKLTNKIRDACSQCDAVIVTHGTDTMAYTAGAVSLALGRGLPIPVVFTGSQLPLVEYGTDARFNLENAMKTVVKACEIGLREVMVVFSDRVLRASRAIKTSEVNFPAFDSPAFPHLASITAVGVEFSPQAHAASLQMKESFEVRQQFSRGILSVEIVPGLEPGILMKLVEESQIQGLLLKSLGAGNVPSEGEYSLIPVIKMATKDYNIPVLVSTKFVGGNTHMDIYEPGLLALEAGAIPTGDMTDVMAQVKFMWALAQGIRDRESLHETMKTSFVGEVTVEDRAKPRHEELNSPPDVS